MTLFEAVAAALRVVTLSVWLVAGALNAGAQTYAPLDAQYFAGRPADALAGYEALLARDSTNINVLWRAARAAIVIGFLADRQDPESPMYLRAESFARTMVAHNPDGVEGHYWLAAALGRRALHADLRTAARLGSATWESANRALAIDSAHAGAHDVIGKLHSEVCKLPYVIRFIAGRLLGMSVVRSTSWEQGERHLRRAVELDSTMILYRLDLAELYMRTSRKAEAIRLLNEVLLLPRIQPFDARLQRDAAEMLHSR